MDGRTQAYHVDEKVKCQIAVVNPEFAEHLLKSCEYPRQRTLRPNHVEELAGEIERGWYVEGTVLKFCHLPDGRVWLVNGQHSLNAVVKTGEPMTFVFVMHRCRDEEEANHIYSVIDMNKPRSLHDTFKAYGIQAELGFSSAWLTAYSSAIKLLQNGFDFEPDAARVGISKSREFHLRAFREYGNYAKMFVDAVGTVRPGSRPFRRGSIMAIGMETIKHHKAKAVDFWRGAYEDDGLAKKDPRKALLTYIRNNGGQGSQIRRLICHATAICWNHWLADQELTNVYPSTVGRIVIDGTPWTSDSHDPFKKLIARVSHKIEPAKYAQLETGVRYEKSGARTPMTDFIGDWARKPVAA